MTAPNMGQVMHTIEHAPRTSVGDYTCGVLAQKNGCLHREHGLSEIHASSSLLHPAAGHGYLPSSSTRHSGKPSSMSHHHQQSNNDADYIPHSSSVIRQRHSTSDSSTNPNSTQKIPASLETKRSNKLHRLLETLRNSTPPPLREHNELVSRIYDTIRSGPPEWQDLPLVQFAAVLGRICNMTTNVGFVYGLLSWEVFRREEERLLQTEKLSSIAASRAINQLMVKTMNRHTKSRDWASDGRKAAKLVFDIFRNNNCSQTDRSFAILLLANNISLDGMLKLAHFPATREEFAAQFERIIQERSELWANLSQRGYRVFDCEQFLNSRGVPPTESQGRLLECPTAQHGPGQKPPGSGQLSF